MEQPKTQLVFTVHLRGLGCRDRAREQGDRDPGLGAIVGRSRDGILPDKVRFEVVGLAGLLRLNLHVQSQVTFIVQGRRLVRLVVVNSGIQRVTEMASRKRSKKKSKKRRKAAAVVESVSEEKPKVRSLRGRKVSAEEVQKRVEVFDAQQRDGFTNQEAAEQLAIGVPAWNQWKQKHRKGKAVPRRSKPAQEGRGPEVPAVRGPAAVLEVGELVRLRTRVSELEGFIRALREVMEHAP